MMQLSRAFEIWFDDDKFSVAEVLAFTADHLGRLTSNNPLVSGGSGGGVFDTLIAETEAAYLALGGTASSGAVGLAVRKARTYAKRQHLKLILDTLAEREGLVRSTFKKNSAVYLEFYPGGMMAYRRAREAELSALLTSYIAAGNEHLPAVGTEFQALLGTWNTAYADASQQTGVVSGSSGSRAAAMTAMQRQLMTNLLTLALRFLGQTDMEKVYFNQSKLNNRQSGEEESNPVSPAVP